MPSEMEVEIMIGLDDIAHNRLYTMNLDSGESKPVANYGKRNRAERCYCKELKQLGVRR